MKLQYEWKNIYRQMSSQSSGEGVVSKKLFEEALTSAGVYLSNLEIKSLVDKFGDGSKIKFEELSRELQLNSNAIAVMRSTKDKIKRLRSAAHNV